METFTAQIVNSGLATRRSLSGCSDAEIRRLEDTFGLRLPGEYKAFLRTMGHDAGRFMEGTDIFYKYLFENRTAAEEALDEIGNPFYLGPSMFVFSSHQGYIFHLFYCDTHSDDPPVFGFAEGEPELTRVSKSFSEFLLRLAIDETTSWGMST